MLDPNIKSKLKKVSEVLWELPIDFKEGMNVPGRFYATEDIIDDMDNQVFDQLANVAMLPGIVKYAYCMPDGHSGYGCPIGGVAAFDLDKGVISPGICGFDINCGVRLIKTDLTLEEVKPKIKELIDAFFKLVPAGVGSKGLIKLDKNKLKEVCEKGSEWCLENGYATEQEVDATEDRGRIQFADFSALSQKAAGRGMSQLGSLGSGNHYLEVQVVDKIFDKELAKKFGITKKNQILIMVHCGSRGLGHQVATDFVKSFGDVMKKYNIHVKDRELACAPFKSEEGQKYHKAMACAANFGFANRQIILHQIKKGLEEVFGKSSEELGIRQIYDVAHNVVKIEKHKVDGKEKELLIHRKGATRCFGPRRMQGLFKETGQPVLIGGSMQTSSYLLVGTDEAENLTWSSTMHGAGRKLSRMQAKKQVKGDVLEKEMREEGIYIKAVSYGGLAEEAGAAYKDVDEVIETMELAGVSKKVISLKPLGNIKG